MVLRRRRTSSVSSEEALLKTSNSNSCPAIKVPLAKRKKPDGPIFVGFQVFVVLLVISFALYSYIYFDHFHYHLVHFYANQMDDHHAMHVLGHKLLKQRTNASAAFHWFRKSAEKGHPHSAYNLAAGHLSGYETDVQKGEVRKLLKYAAKHGVKEAEDLLISLCKEKPKYCDH